MTLRILAAILGGWSLAIAALVAAEWWTARRERRRPERVCRYQLRHQPSRARPTRVVNDYDPMGALLRALETEGRIMRVKEREAEHG